MDQQKNTYYIWLQNGQISRDRDTSPWNFQVEATDEEISQLREYFDQNYSVEWQNFYRSHVPYVQYHYDRENDAYDKGMQKIYEMIYKIGNEEARKHIESMGILESLAKETDGFTN
ncbi:hydrolase [Bacillus sp. M6-12]|uniref:hydrolase n=1 Tax=Bacillus sp. M6-12 TaxID=2054166 RepID=UPI000C7783D2|nr:hydrolase [Bacillus sp. M6-12]PLS14947.1 hydrolase [Bacillus sp. M6-12]